MKRLGLVFVLIALAACVSTPLGAQRRAEQDYQDCVLLNGEGSCQREKALADKRREELQDRDLNQGPNSGLNRN